MVLHKLRITTWAPAYSSISTSTKNPSEGVAASSKKHKLKQHEYKGTQQDLHQILHTCTLSRRLVGLLQQASFDSWLSYPTRHQLEMVLRTRVHYSPLQYTTEDPPPSSYGRAILGTHAYIEIFSSIHLLVYELYRQPSSPLPRMRLFE